MNEKELIEYYNKFNEDKRLNTKHGQIEYLTAMEYISRCLKNIDNPSILDVGAGTGKYSLALKEMGYQVTAIELVKHNLRVIESKGIEAYQGNATDLSRFDDNSFDIVLLFGPLYHLISIDDKVKALKEAKRIVKDNGYILSSYCMNEYAILTYGFKENNIKECLNNGLVDNNYHCLAKDNDLYSMVRLEDINLFNELAGLKRINIVNQDGPTEYMKGIINKMDDDTFKAYFDYHLHICERPELLGAGRHILDIVRK